MNTPLETLIAKYESKLARAQLNITDDGDDPINTLWQSDVDEFTAVLAALRQQQVTAPQAREFIPCCSVENCASIQAELQELRAIRPAAGMVLKPLPKGIRIPDEIADEWGKLKKDNARPVENNFDYFGEGYLAALRNYVIAAAQEPSNG